MAFNRLAACKDNTDAWLLTRSKADRIWEKLLDLDEVMKHGSTEAKIAAATKIKRLEVKIWSLYRKMGRLQASNKRMLRELARARDTWSPGFGTWDASDVVELRINCCRRYALGRERETNRPRFDAARKILRKPNQMYKRGMFVASDDLDLWIGDAPPIDEDD